MKNKMEIVKPQRNSHARNEDVATELVNLKRKQKKKLRYERNDV